MKGHKNDMTMKNRDRGIPQDPEAEPGEGERPPHPADWAEFMANAKNLPEDPLPEPTDAQEEEGEDWKNEQEIIAAWLHHREEARFGDENSPRWEKLNDNGKAFWMQEALFLQAHIHQEPPPAPTPPESVVERLHPSLFVSVSVLGCSECPLGTRIVDPIDGWHGGNEDEYHFDCEHFGKKVWGEYPKCERYWEQRVKDALALIERQAQEIERLKRWEAHGRNVWKELLETRQDVERTHKALDKQRDLWNEQFNKANDLQAQLTEATAEIERVKQEIIRVVNENQEIAHSRICIWTERREFKADLTKAKATIERLRHKLDGEKHENHAMAAVHEAETTRLREALERITMLKILTSDDRDYFRLIEDAFDDTQDIATEALSQSKGE